MDDAGRDAPDAADAPEGDVAVDPLDAAEPFTWPPDGQGARREHRRHLGCAAGGIAGLGGLGLAVVAVLWSMMSALTFDGCEWEEPEPNDGRNSQRVPVDVAPTTGLVDGTTVLVTSEAFEAGAEVAITMCLAEAAVEEAGLSACDDDVGTRLPVGDDGVLRAAYAVPRVITVDGEAHDCASGPERCIVVAAASGDYDLSGGQPLTFADGLPPVELVPSDGRPVSVYLPGAIDPAGPVSAGDTATATATGFVPGEDLLVALCSSDVLTEDPMATCIPADPRVEHLIVLVAVGTTEADDDGAVTVPVDVPGVLTLPEGTVRCADDPGRCGVVIAATADLQRSAYLGLTVTR